MKFPKSQIIETSDFYRIDKYNDHYKATLYTSKEWQTCSFLEIQKYIIDKSISAKTIEELRIKIADAFEEYNAECNAK